MTYRILLIFLLPLFCSAQGKPAPSEGTIRYDFTEAEAWTQESLLEVFQLNERAKVEGALKWFPKTRGNIDGYLLMMDVGDGVPVLELPFREAAKAHRGHVNLRLATSASQGQFVRVHLIGGDTVLATLELKNNTKGAFRTGEGEPQAFHDTVRWLGNSRDFQIRWQRDAKTGELAVDFRFTPRGEDLSPFEFSGTVATDQTPTALRFSVGYASAKGRGLIIDEIEIAVDPGE